MQIVNIEVPADYELVLFGDNQEGNALQYHSGYNSCLQYIANDPNRYAIHMGDEQEAFWIDDPRYTPASLLTSPLDQQRQVVQDLKPLGKRLITMLYGNHTHRLYPKTGDITLSTCQTLGIPYGGFSCVVHFCDQSGLQFKGFFTHGRRLIRSNADDPIRRAANEELQLKQHLKNKMGDCILMAKGHTHRLIIAEPTPQLFLTTEDKHIQEQYTGTSHKGLSHYIHPDHRWYVNTGSFLKTFEPDINSYSEIGEYDPVELGYAVVEVVDRKIYNIRKVIL